MFYCLSCYAFEHGSLINMSNTLLNEFHASSAIVFNGAASDFLSEIVIAHLSCVAC